MIGSGHQKSSIKKAVIKNFAIFTGKHLCWRFFFNKVAGIFLTHWTTLTDVFQGILRNFPQQLFFMTASGDCTGLLLSHARSFSVRVKPIQSGCRRFRKNCPLYAVVRLDVIKMLYIFPRLF